MIITKVTDFMLSNKWYIIGTIIVCAFIVSLLVVAIIKNKKRITSQTERMKRLITVAVFASLSTVLYFLKFNLPTIFPSFLEFQFSNVPAYIAGFLLGPIEGVLVVLIRTLIKIFFSHTLGVGELADLIIGMSVMLVSSLIYNHYKTKKGGVLSIIFGTITWVIVAVIANAFIIIPFYIEAFGDGNPNIVIGICSMIPGINSSNYMIKFILFATVPFNSILSIVVGIVTFLVYKRISILFNMIGSNDDDDLDIVEEKNE